MKEIFNRDRIREEIIIPPYEGRSAFLRKGEELIIIDLEGKQVGDFVCFNHSDTQEYVSPVHMRASLSSIRLKKGDLLYSNRRRPLMQLVEDTVGVHDIFFPACDYYRYKMDFDHDDHPNCHDNLEKALNKFNIYPAIVPDPINLFMNIVLDEQGDYVIEEPLSKPGDYVKLKALEDVVIACTTCSQDMAPVNGWKVTSIKMQIVEAE
ncbi:urea carboxylase-associated family protein [Bacillus sp. DTU_2020_1000418_1_SI_GHA_SEK_038]|uniref:urea carboxylase-associated family protein n=1 Tax=Bacillus sp. DTU_2020_1000418_1_SI_GHA_SEK_038 TaxID=3077585 RepID=UPI0028EE35E4|nr:urea carboxylase-associated family protein [Bacillus sp. DTU_2020_1000418_1_SI_GHA_SEK_038]WNS77409.1 urea carboxylase-associated family protein [Bacillus sp. DTU_2020_1000418_1_SI_GHA_SEK_038]